MSTIWNLFKLLLNEKMSFGHGRKVWKTALTIFFYLLVMAGLTTAFSFAFVRFVAVGLYPGVDLLALLLLFTQILSFALALGAIIKNLYQSKDNDFLMALPCSNNDIFLSKIMVLYVYEFVANALYTVPILIAFSFVFNVSVGFWLLSVLFLFLFPLMSLVFAGFVSVPVILIVNKLKKHPAAAIVILLLLSAGLLALYMFFLISLTEQIDFTGQQNTILTNVNNVIADTATYTFIFRFMAQCLLATSGWWWKLLCILAVTAIFFGLTVVMVKKLYFNLAMKNSETSNIQTHKIGKNFVESPFKSIIRKETYSLFRAPGTVFQYFLFTILMPFIVLMYDRLLLSITVNSTGQALILASHVLVVAIMSTLSNVVSASAISREGGNFYITKMIPTSPRVQVYAKVVFNIIFTYLALIVTGVITGFFTSIPIWCNVLSILGGMVIAFGHILTSILIDAKKPVLDWFDINDIDKMSKNSIISMALGLLFAFVMFFVMVPFAGTVHTVIPWLVMLAVASAYTLVIFLVFHFRINKIYAKVGC